MRNVNKLIALVMAVAMIVVSFGMVATASTFPDLQVGTATYEAASTLNALGIFRGEVDEETGGLFFHPDRTITRAEFSAVVCRALGLEGIIARVDTQFVDVTAAHWASGYIRMADQLGVVRGMGDGTFVPDAPVTYEQAITMIMRAIGYSPMAAARGGFPTGYLIAASTSGVTAAVGVVAQADPAPRGLVARVLYTALDTPMMEQVIWTPGGEPYFVIMDGISNPRRTLLSQAHGVTKLRARITGNRYSTLVDHTPISNAATQDAPIRADILDNFRTENTRYHMPTATPIPRSFRPGTSNAGEFLGMQVLLYVREVAGESEDVIISVVPEAGRNVAITFNISDLSNFSTSGTADRLEYHRDNQRNAASVTLAAPFLRPDGSTDPGYRVIYNGRVMPINSIFTSGTGNVRGDRLANGTITVIDTDGNGFFDLVRVNSAIVFVVDEDGVDTRNHRISSRNGVGRLNLDTDAFDVSYTITRNGEVIELSDVSAWDVLMVERCAAIAGGTPVDDGLINIRVVGEIIEMARVTESSTSSTSWNPNPPIDYPEAEGATFFVDGREFSLAVNAYGVEALRVGVTGDFFICENGNIAAFILQSTGDVHYGFITGTVMDDSGFAQRGRIQIVDIEGGVTVRQLANVFNLQTGFATSHNLRGDGSTPTNPWGPLADLDELTGLLVRYEVNANGQISAIQLPRTNGDANREFSSVGTAAWTLPWTAATTAFADREGSMGRFEFDANNNRLINRAGNGRTTSVNEDTLIFFMNHRRDQLNQIITPLQWDPDRSEVRRGTALVDGDMFDNMWVFDEDSRGNASVAVAFDHIFTAGTNLAVFNSFSNIQNNEGENVVNVSFFEDGVLRSMLSTTETRHTFQNMERGTGFRYSVNSRGAIDAYTIAFTVTHNQSIVAGGGTWEPVRPSINVIEVDDTLPDWRVDPSNRGLWIADGDEVDSWTMNTAGRTETRLIFGPVVDLSGGRLRVGPSVTFPADTTDPDSIIPGGTVWFNYNQAFNFRGAPNVYILDPSRATSAQRLMIGDLGDIDSQDTRWTTVGAWRGTQDTPVLVDGDWVPAPAFPAPALDIRDWVIMQEVNGAVTDIIVLKARSIVLR